MPGESVLLIRSHLVQALEEQTGHLEITAHAKAIALEVGSTAGAGPFLQETIEEIVELGLEMALDDALEERAQPRQTPAPAPAAAALQIEDEEYFLP